MDQYTLNLLFVGASFALYIGIAIWARACTTSEFYTAGRGVHPVMNGMATAADWMSAASFISLAGIVAFAGYSASAYLMGWTGGYVLLALLLAPYLRKFGKFTVPEFIGDRFYSRHGAARGGDLPHRDLGHLRHRADDRRGRRLLALPRGGHHHRPLHRRGGGLLLRRARRHEGHHLHAGGAVRRADHRLHHPRDLHLAPAHRQPDPAPRALQRAPGLGRAAPRPSQRGRAGSGLRRLHHAGRIAHGGPQHDPLHLLADDRHRGAAPRHHPLLHRAAGGGRALVGGLGARLHRAALPHLPGGGRDGAAQHHRHHLPGRRRRGAHRLRRAARLDPQLGGDGAPPVRGSRTATAASSTTTATARPSPRPPRRAAGRATSSPSTTTSWCSPTPRSRSSRAG